MEEGQENIPGLQIETVNHPNTNKNYIWNIQIQTHNFFTYVSKQ